MPAQARKPYFSGMDSEITLLRRRRQNLKHQIAGHEARLTALTPKCGDQRPKGMFGFVHYRVPAIPLSLKTEGLGSGTAVGL